MNKHKSWLRWAVPLLLAAGLCALIWGLAFRQAGEQVRAQVIGMTPEPSGEEFERVYGPRSLVFPRDHGPHPDFLTEWWYYTGNLATGEGRRFGYQLTFFRRAAQPPGERSQRESSWAVEQVYLAHFTVTDVTGQRFQAFERFERGALGLAGARGEPAYAVWLHDWSVEQVEEDVYRLRAQEDGVAIDLRLVDRKGIVLQGDRGYSQKGPQAGNASIYYSQTRLESEGTLTLDGETYPVSGLSWLDREISTSALSEGQVGWDWFALQLDDGSELMAYVLRRKDGAVDGFSRGTYIRPDGTTVSLAREDFEISPAGAWRSPHSGAVYLAKWMVRVPSLGLDLRVEPLLADQELNVSYTYWEGAVRIGGEHAGSPVAGYGYVELTGYAESMEGDV